MNPEPQDLLSLRERCGSVGVVAAAFSVPLAPTPQPRPRIGKGRAYRQDHPVHAFKSTAQLEARIAGVRPLVGPLCCTVEFVMPRPKRVSAKAAAGLAWCSKRPDIDNLLKAILDALNGVAWTDDGQVACVLAWKRYARTAESPSVGVEIRRLLPA